MQEIAITPQEVKELLELIDRHGNHFIDDLRQAGLIESEPSTLTIAGTRCKALIIQRRNCKELNELLLRFSL